MTQLKSFKSFWLKQLNLSNALKIKHGYKNNLGTPSVRGPLVIKISCLFLGGGGNVQAFIYQVHFGSITLR